MPAESQRGSGRGSFADRVQASQEKEQEEGTSGRRSTETHNRAQPLQAEEPTFAGGAQGSRERYSQEIRAEAEFREGDWPAGRAISRLGKSCDSTAQPVAPGRAEHNGVDLPARVSAIRTQRVSKGPEVTHEGGRAQADSDHKTITAQPAEPILEADRSESGAVHASERLYNEYKERQERKEERHRRRKEAEIAALPVQSKAGSNSSTSPDPYARTQRLYEEHRHRKTKLERMREQEAKEELAQLELNSVHRAAKEELRSKGVPTRRHEDLYKDAAPAESLTRAAKTAQERSIRVHEEMQEMASKSVHRHLSPSDLDLDDMVSRLHEKELNKRRANFARKRDERDKEDREELKAMEENSVHTPARRKRQWTDQDLRQLSTRLHMGLVRKFQPRNRSPRRPWAKAVGGARCSPAAVTQTKRRCQLVSDVFALLGRGQQYMDSSALRRYAEFCGFEGDEKAWAAQFKQMCIVHGWGPAGADAETFAAAVNDADGSSFCSDEDLQLLLLLLCCRNELGLQLFGALDVDGSGRLLVRETLLYARQCGFNGTSAEWRNEYFELCHSNGVQPMVGFDVPAFLLLISNKSSNMHCSDDELQLLVLENGCRLAMVAELVMAIDLQKKRTLPSKQGAPALPLGARDFARMISDPDSSEFLTDDVARAALVDLRCRPELVLALFQALDEKRSQVGVPGRLQARQLRPLAEFCQFEGSDDDWLEEYKALSLAYGWDDTIGADVLAFARMLGDPESVAHCDDEELHRLLLQVT